MSQPNATAYQRALGRLSRLHHDEFADLLAAERLRMGMTAERNKMRCGTRSSYANGCRCHRCCQAQTEYWRRKLQQGIASDDPRHGQLRGYQSGCRCDACRKAKAAYNRERYWARKGAVKQGALP